MNSETKSVDAPIGPLTLICFLLACWSGIGGSASAGDLTPLQMNALTLHFPTNTPGLSSFVLTNTLKLNAWVNTNSFVMITATNSNFLGYSNVAPFVVLQHLIQAYQTADLQAVQSLYDSDSGPIIAATLADSPTRDRWFQSVTNIQVIVPLVIWNETNRIAAMTRFLPGGAGHTGANNALLPVVFDMNYNLMATELRSPVASYLSIYFSDGSRSPNGLLLTNYAGPNNLRAK